jgi:hypothetical protein
MSVEQAGSNGTRDSDNGGVYRPEFPSARYFQIHFEHIEALLGEARRCLDALRQQLADFQRNADDDAVRKSTAAGPKRSLRGTGKPRKAPRKRLEPGNPVLGTVSGK